jgi:hypothetical protein
MLNVRLIGIYSNITWAITQPTPLQIRVTIDGIVRDWYINNPVSATGYYAQEHLGYSNNIDMDTTSNGNTRSFLMEGRSIKVEVKITWAINQPTPLVCRVRYAKR